VADSTIQFLGIIIILLAMVISVIMTQFIRRRRDLFTLRKIAAFDVLPTWVGVAIEANRPLHMSLGSVELGGRSTVLALASAELFYQLTQQASIGDVAPILTLSNTSALPLGYDTLRRAYASRNRLERYRSNSVRWYPGGTRSLAFAAALTGLMSTDNVSANVLVGSFGPELALVMDASYRRNLPVIAASDQLEGQAIAYALADQPLIGEEIFAAGSYLGRRSAERADVVTIDLLRWLLIAAIFVVMVITGLNQIGG
jgi:hypothetical protein